MLLGTAPSISVTIALKRKQVAGGEGREGGGREGGREGGGRGGEGREGGRERVILVVIH